jgi:O-antigen chain-terminating methyltransferase
MSPEQVATVVEQIRERVRSRYEKSVTRVPDFELPNFEKLGQIRDAAEVKAESIGTVNPRQGGVVNAAIQALKKLVARLLYWHVREQAQFNRAVVQFMDRILLASVEQNSNLLRVAHSFSALKDAHERVEQMNAALRAENAVLQAENAALQVRMTDFSQQVTDLLRHWTHWHPAWEEKLTQAEIHFLEMVRDIENSARNVEGILREDHVRMHEAYRKVLADSVDSVQQKLWSDLNALRNELEHIIHAELRLIRRRTAAAGADSAVSREPASAAAEASATLLAANGAAGHATALDYARFEERFRGAENYISKNQEFYLPLFRGCRRVLDLGCGRGEFLQLVSGEGVTAIGVDTDPDAIAACLEKGLVVEQRDLFEYLAAQPDESFDGIFCSQVVEHLTPDKISELVRLAAQKLGPNGILAVETPNPSCLAIFARDFYIDPTHVRPVPSSLLSFYFEEAGVGGLEIHELHPASEIFPELAALDKVDGLQEFRRKFFGGLDYTLVGRKLES